MLWIDVVEEKIIPEVKNISQKSPNDDFLGLLINNNKKTLLYVTICVCVFRNESSTHLIYYESPLSFTACPCRIHPSLANLENSNVFFTAFVRLNGQNCNKVTRFYRRFLKFTTSSAAFLLTKLVCFVLVAPPSPGEHMPN